MVSCSDREEAKSEVGISTENQRYSGSPTGERNPSGRTSSNQPGREFSNTSPGEPTAPEGKGAEDGTTGAATGEPGTRGGSYGSGPLEK